MSTNRLFPFTPMGVSPHAVRLWLKDDGLSVILHLSDLERIAAVIAEHGTPALKAATALPEPPTAPTRPPGTAERYREQAAGLLPRMPLPDHLRRKE